MFATAKRGTELASGRSSATFFAERIPVVATGIETKLNADLATLWLLIDGYALFFASLLLGAGVLGDRFRYPKSPPSNFKPLFPLFSKSSPSSSLTGR